MSWGSVIGAGIGAMTGRRDNKQAAKAARREQDWEREAAYDQYIRQTALQDDAQAFEAEQAASAMQFSERMANTQHQREVKDLYAAGLNPILSGTGGMGAAAPTGQAGHSSAGSAAKAGAARQQIIPTAQAIISGASAGAQIEKTMAERDLLEAQADETRARTPGHALNQRQVEASTDNIMQDTKVKKALEGKTEEEIVKIRAEVSNLIETTWRTQAETANIRQQTQTGKASERLHSAEALVRGVEARTMESIEKMDMNELLKAAPALAPIIHVIKPLLMRMSK